VERHALATTGGRYALWFTGPVPATAAAALAERVGARLARPTDQATNQLLGIGAPWNQGFWMDLHLDDHRVVGPDGQPAGFVAGFPRSHWRGYAALPAGRHPIVIARGGDWGLRPDGLAEGVALEWPTE
jgi:hypothetical protein